MPKKPKFDISSDDLLVARALHLKEAALRDAFALLETAANGEHVLDAVEAVIRRGNWGESHEKTLMRCALAACMFMRVCVSVTDRQQRKESLRRLEWFMECQLGNLRMEIPPQIMKLFAQHRSGHREGGRSGPPSSRRSGAPASSVSPLMANIAMACAAHDSAPPEGQ